MRSPGPTRAPRPSRRQALFCCAWSLLLLFLLVDGCGAPGEPLPPSPQIPAAISDLSGHQAGDGVQLTFTMPNKSTRGERLKDTPTVEILRGWLKADGTVDPKSFRVVDTIPGSLVSTYQQKNKVTFEDPVSPQEIRADPGKSVVYRARTRVSDKKTSESSNDVRLNLYAVPEPINKVDAMVTEHGIELSWPAPTHTSGGESLANIREYRVYRGELEATSAENAAKDARQAVWKSPPLKIATTQAPGHLDTSFDYGKTYGYMVKSVVPSGGTLLESGDSPLTIVTPEDTFPPAAPQGLVAAVLPGSAPGTVVVDLSWSINVEPDLAGYRVYRSEEEGARGKLLTPELLPTPAYRDTSVQLGKRYWYTVKALDRVGNESAPSPAVFVEAQQPSS